MLRKIPVRFLKRCLFGSIGSPTVAHFSTSKCTFLHSSAVKTFTALDDNYMYVISDLESKSAIAIDPVEPKKILEHVYSANLKLEAVLTTHHHRDHAGGNKLIASMVSDLPIYGFDDRIEGLTHKVKHDEILNILTFKIRCLHTPCHTSGHVCYFFLGPLPVCFTGDTLFVAGCGRFFEGSAEQMVKSLKTLTDLPPDTQVFCGHEYTMQNLRFALSVDKENDAIKEKLKSVEICTQNGHPSVPSTIGDELSYNPFLRLDKKAIQTSTNETDPILVMAALRTLKDKFQA